MADNGGETVDDGGETMLFLLELRMGLPSYLEGQTGSQHLGWSLGGACLGKRVLCVCPARLSVLPRPWEAASQENRLFSTSRGLRVEDCPRWAPRTQIQLWYLKVPWLSLVAQTVKNLSLMQETWV